MLLKTEYETQDQIPEAHRELYSERGDKWVLTGVEGIKTQADIDKLNEANRKERDFRRDAERKLKEFGDLDPAEVHKQLDEIEELRAKAEASGGDEEAIQKRIDAAIRRETGPLQRENQKLKERAETAEGKVEELDGTIKRTATESEMQKIAQGKIRPEAIDDWLMHRDIFEVGEDGKPVTKDGVGVTPGVGPEVALQEILERKTHWAPSTQGAGARGSNGGNNFADNPYKAGNLTKASQIRRESPEKAEQMARAAGFESHADAMSKGLKQPAA